MDSKDYLKDITEIKNIMNRSSRFISLSGLSGILAGIYALIGAVIAYSIALNSQREHLIFGSKVFNFILIDLFLVALFSIVTAIIITTRKAKKNGENFWDTSSKRLLINFLIPLITGAIYILIKLNSNHYGLTSSLMLIFYGLALVNASKYTIGYIRYLGITEIILGLICAIFPGYGFWFWVVGFGFLHIIYGALMFYKYER